MLVTKTLICLANSFRPGGSCVAGIEFTNGQIGAWVRPISQRGDRAINDQEKTFADGSKLSVLDIVEIDFDSHRPEQHQTENWLIRPGTRWRKVGQATRDHLAAAVLSVTSPLWRPAQSTFTGRNDQVSAAVAMHHNYSLVLINPSVATVDVSHNQIADKREVWVSFTWASTLHKMKLTDGVQFARLNTEVGDCHTLNNPLLCISLAEVWAKRGTASKLVAGLIL